MAQLWMCLTTKATLMLAYKTNSKVARFVVKKLCFFMFNLFFENELDASTFCLQKNLLANLLISLKWFSLHSIDYRMTFDVNW